MPYWPLLAYILIRLAALAVTVISGTPAGGEFWGLP